MAATQHNAVEEYKRIIDLVRQADYAYYVEGDPVMEDPEYDGLMQELHRIETNWPQIAVSDSPTQRVGSSLSGDFQKVIHEVPMLSLLDAFEDEDLEAFLASIGISQSDLEYILENKFDGLAVKLVYEYGKLVQGATRGDGKVGEDITHNVRTIKDVPLKIDIDDPLLEVIGEVIIEKEAFKKYNEEQAAKGLPTLANTRNGAAGSLRQKDPAKCAARPLSFRPYGIAKCEGSFQKYNLRDVILEKLGALGFHITEYGICKNIKQIRETYKNLDKQREFLPYDIDGMVIKVNQLHYCERIGFRSKSPKWALAYKFEAPSTYTTIKDIILSIGRTGAITPVALLDEVECGGVNVTHASLHNQEEIDRLGIDIGSKVLIKRAGDVIPKVVAAVDKVKPYQIPDICPACGDTLDKSETIFKCANSACSIVESFAYFVSDKCMNIEGLSAKRVELMVEFGLIKKFSDLFFLTKSQLMELPKVGDRMAEKILAAIDKAREGTKYQKFLCALQIPGVGEGTSDMLSQFPFENLANMSIEQLEALEDIGPTTAESIYTWFKKNMDEASYLFGCVTLIYEEKKVAALQQTFVFTGKVTRPRKELEQMAKDAGHKTSKSVNELTVLVVGEKAGSKLTKAKAKGCKILTEDEFINLIEAP